MNNDIIVALEFGSSYIRGIAGRKGKDGSVSVLGIEYEKTTDGVRKGAIYNIDKTVNAIKRIISKFNEKLNCNICKAYVGVSGQSLHTASNFVSRQLEMKVKITQELVDGLWDSNSATVYPDSKILEMIPQEYLVGNRSITEPVGVQSDQIEGRFVNVVAKKTLLDNIKKSMRASGIEIADMFISPIALADCMLSENEKRSGCAFVDFGADTTTVSVYNGNLLRQLVVIPLGGANITADIATSQQMELEEAETLKRKHGIAYVPADSDTPRMLPISNDRSLNENDLQAIIGARQEEIIANVWNQFDKLYERLLSGIIITGGASQLRDTIEAIKHHTHADRVKSAKSLITNVEVASGVQTVQGCSVDTLIALLMHGDSDCTTDAPRQDSSDSDEVPLTTGGTAAIDLSNNNNDDTEEISIEEEEKVKEPKEPKEGFGSKLKRFIEKLVTEGDE